MLISPVYNMEYIGIKLREYRIKNGYSVEELRSYLGLGTVQSVYRIENGKQLPNAESLLALMELYKITPEVFRGGKNSSSNSRIRTDYLIRKLNQYLGIIEKHSSDYNDL